MSNSPKIPEGAHLLKIDDHQITDLFDYHFYNDPAKKRRFTFSINGKKIIIHLKPGDDIKLTFEEPEYKSCENDCDYCFVRGLPEGLRKKLYFRDDDYRLSFLFGNFLSLTNITDIDIGRIIKLRLSPLYVSVHSTDSHLRARLFRNKKAQLILEQLKKLVEGNIQIHCQVVVIPGLTDGRNIENTVNDLSKLFPGVSSVGIVPVGRTKFLKNISGITKGSALKIVKSVYNMHKDFRKRFKKGFVYLADEFFIRSGIPIPERDYYDDFPQYENGIGMIRQLLNEIKEIKKRDRIYGRFLFVTGKLAYPYINYLKTKLNGKKLNIDVLCVKNKFFGESVTVSGLLVGKDIYEGTRSIQNRYDRIILPPNCVNTDGKFLDDFEINDSRFIVSPYSIKELFLWLQ